MKRKNKILNESGKEKQREPQAKPRRRKTRAVVSAAVILVTIAGLFWGGFMVAEPWIGPFDSFAGTGNKSGPEIVLSVGQSAVVSVPLGDNEKIASIKTPDPDILQIEGAKVIALGEFWTTITVTTTEIEIPKRQVKQVRIFDWDLTHVFDGVRTWLRDLFGVEAKQPERTELRTLNTYEIPVLVKGYEKAQGQEITVMLGSKGTDPTKVDGEEKTVLFSDESEIVKTYMTQDGASAYEALATGNTELHSQVGFWKAVPEETYIEYLEKNPEMGAHIAAVRKVCADNHVEYPYEGMVFVTQRQISYKVKAIEMSRGPIGGGATRPGSGSGNGSGGGNGNGGGGSDGSGDENSGGNSGGSATTLLGMINEARANAGLNPLVWHNTLVAAAKIRAQEITEVMSHTRPNGQPFYTVNDLVYGENLAGGFATERAVFDAWMNSSGHRANILNPRFRTVGYAYLNFGAKYWHYWALLFGL